MNKTKHSMPLSLRIAFVTFVILGIFITGFLMMRRNSIKDNADALEQAVLKYEEAIAKKQEQLAAPVDEEYIKGVARENGYLMPGEEIYYIEE